MFDQEKYPWLKSKGYLHLTPRINLFVAHREIIKKVTNPNYMSTYSFFPLLHSVIKERRYRRDPENGNKRSHTKIKSGQKVKNVKVRPLHYATHMDSIIFAYYAHILTEKYEEVLKKTQGLGECIIAYRRIKHPTEKGNKNTIHFAHEVFEEIKKRALYEPVAVLKFDITSFFNHMDHGILKSKWMSLFAINGKLPNHHFNVFKAATQFSYILKDDFRLPPSEKKNARRNGFDERRLSEIRNKHGIHSFFASVKEFRQAIKSKQLRVYKFPFRNAEGRIVGIPQGLPISAVLANLYLMDFDLEMLRRIERINGFYRRYSDDIIVICKPSEAAGLSKETRRLIKDDSRVEISEEKTERFLFKNEVTSNGENKLVSIKVDDVGLWKVGIPLTYLGFDFFGHRTSIKAANLAKFYRRIIVSARRKCKYAVSVSRKSPGNKPVIFSRQLYKLYTHRSLSKMTLEKRNNRIIADGKGGFKLKSVVTNRKFKSNFLTYIDKAARIMNEPKMKRQVRKRRLVLNKAISKNLNKQLSRYD